MQYTVKHANAKKPEENFHTLLSEPDSQEERIGPGSIWKKAGSIRYALNEAYELLLQVKQCYTHDPRYDAVGSLSRREELLSSYVAKLGVKRRRKNGEGETSGDGDYSLVSLYSTG